MFEWAEVIGVLLVRQQRKVRVKYFVSTDTTEAVLMAKKRFGEDHVIVTPGEIMV